MPDELTLDEAAALAPLTDAGDAQARAREGAVVIDVRGTASVERDGALEGAIPVDRHNLAAEFGVDSPTRHAEVADLDTPVVVVCGSVRGSGPVAAELINMGYRNVVHVDGGFGAWQEAAGRSAPAEGPACAV